MFMEKQDNNLKSKKKILNIICFIGFFMFQNVMISQDARGSISKNNETQKKGEKYALIVGISEYNETSLNLKYAKNDAALFKDYLAKVERLPEENIKYLINSKATSLAISIEMEELYNTTEEGDVIYLYFAGHGDVVKKYNKNSGFLLAWNSDTSQNYYGKAGAVPLSEFNNLIAAVSEKGVKTVLILDACRSGFLFEEGSQENLETIKAMFQNTTSFLSCGPNQLSYEAKKLEHGYFTYYLVLGLMGAADETIQDNNIQFFELELFLKNNVKGETNGNQIPEIRNQTAATDIYKPVNQKDKSEALNILKSSGKIGNVLASRGVINVEDKVYNNHEIKIIKQFNQAIENKNYEGQPNSAYEIYKIIKTDRSIDEEILKKMKFSIIKVFSTSATILINEYIGGSEFLPPSSEFTLQAKYLQIVLELIGNESPSYKDNIVTSKLFLESYSVIRRRNYSKFPTAKNKLKKALKLEPRAAYVHNALGILYNESRQYDSAYYHYSKASKIIPNWTYPIANIGANFHDQYQYSKAKAYYEKSLELEGDKTSAFANLGSFYQRSGNYLLAEKNYKKSLKIDSTDIWVLFKMGDLYSEKGNKKLAKKWYSKIPKKNVNRFKRVLDYIYVMDIEKNEAERILKEFIEKEPKYSVAFEQYADFNRRINDKSRDEDEKKQTFKLADEYYSQAIELNPNGTWAYYGRAILWGTKNYRKALSFLDENIQTNTNKPRPYYYYAQFLLNYHYAYEELDFKSETYLKIKAKKYYLSAIEKDKYFLPAYNGITKLNDTEVYGAEENLTLILNLITENPQIVELWDALGLTYIEMKTFEKANKAYSKLLALDSTYAKAYENIAYTKFMLDKLKDAETYYLKAKTANPERYENFSWGDGYSISNHLIPVAEEYFLNGNLKKAKETYILTNKLDPSKSNTLALTNVNYLLSDSEESYKSLLELNKAFVYYGKDYNYTYSETEYTEIVELLLKTSIDNNDTETANKSFETLLELDYAPSKVLQLLYFRYIKDKKSSKKVLNNIHPLLLSKKYLHLRYSENAIKLLKR